MLQRQVKDKQKIKTSVSEEWRAKENIVFVFLRIYRASFKNMFLAIVAIFYLDILSLPCAVVKEIFVRKVKITKEVVYVAFYWKEIYLLIL